MKYHKRKNDFRPRSYKSDRERNKALADRDAVRASLFLKCVAATVIVYIVAAFALANSA